MTAVPNALCGGVPTGMTIGGLSIVDGINFSITENATTFKNLAGDKSYPMNGGVVSRTFTGEATFYDSDLGVSDTIQAGTQLAAFGASFAAKTTAGSAVTYALATSAKARVKSLTAKDNGGRLAWTVVVDIYSSNGTTYPIVIS